jgi:hypothetical protein
MLINHFGSLVPYGAAQSRHLQNCGMAIRQIVFPAFVVWMLMSFSVQAQGTWTRLANTNPAFGSGTMNLLTDGTVIVQGSGVSDTWTKLTPDSSGNYINGTWSFVASSTLARLYTGNVVLPSGDYFVLGGEFAFGPSGFMTRTNTGEIYNPLTNTWSASAPFPQTRFGDGQAVLLPNGRVLAGYLFGTQTYLYNPATNSWTQTGSKIRNDRNNKETWLLLPSGDVLCYEISTIPLTGPGFAQRYISSIGIWVDAGSVPVPLTDSTVGLELGPGAVLPDGRVIQTGANINTAIYTPSTNTWVAGPVLPAGLGADDSPGALLPNGHFIFAVDSTVPRNSTPPTKLYDFDYTTDTLTDVTPTGPLGNELATSAANDSRMLILPNGHLLFNTGRSSLWDYSPTGAPQASWQPTITNVVKTGTSTYLLTGTLLTGISEGANFGNDAGQATNYPIVRLTNSAGVVKYARTTNWTPGISLAGDSTPMTVQFTVPAGIGNGNYQLAVSANGIASANRPFTVGPPVIPSVVTTNYNAGTKTLTLTGDGFANSLTLTLKNGKINIEGANGTKLTNLNTAQSNLVSTSYAHTLKLVLNADLKGGDDAISVVGVDSSTTNINLGPGNDKVAFSLCTITTKLTVNGGTGTDALITTTSTIPPVGPNRVIISVP